MSCDNPLYKTIRIIDEALLATYKGIPCHICDRTDTHGHHRIKRSNTRVDLESNLVALCTECHRAVESGGQKFIEYMIRRGLNGDRLHCNNLPYPQFYEWITDANDDLYDTLPGVLIQEPKPKSKFKWKVKRKKDKDL